MADEYEQALAAYKLASEHAGQVLAQTNDPNVHAAAQRGMDAAAQRLGAVQMARVKAQPAPTMADHADALHPTKAAPSAPGLSTPGAPKIFGIPLY